GSLRSHLRVTDRELGFRPIGNTASPSRFPPAPFRATEGRKSLPEEDAMQRTKPPFRADHVGSILPTAPINAPRPNPHKPHTPAELKGVEDGETEKIIKKREEVGPNFVTDGEYRRSWWHFDFFWGLTGVKKVTLDHGIQFHGVETRRDSVGIGGKLDFPADHP